MAAYNVTHNGKLVNETPVSLKEARQIAENVWGGATIVKVKAAKAVKSAPVALKPFYRGAEIVIIEERQNGWSLVYNADRSQGYTQYFAATAEIEYR